LTGGTGQLAKARKITYVQGTATLTSPTTLDVARVDGGSEQVTFGHAIVAIGSQPARVPGLALDSPRVMDSTSALEIENVPKTLLVIGGGYIGLELGSVYAALGSAVTVVEMTPGLLPGADRDLVAILAKRIEKICSGVLLSTKVIGMVEQADGIKVTFEDEQQARRDQVFEKVLVSVGRKPLSMPGLDKTKAEVDPRGFIKVDAQRRTAEPTIFAIGDIAGEPMLAHKASHEGRVAVEAILGEDVAFEPAAIPAVVFTDPELAWAGLTETDAQKSGRKVEIAKFPWAASGRAMTLDRTDGLTKLVIEPGSERVLGVGIVGPGAGELIAEGTLAIEMGAVASDLSLTIHAHPTLSETVMESAEVFFGHATHVYRPKRH
jgi:dihydrolipoamide dehydrogenase